MIFVFEVHVQPGYSAEAYAGAWVRASEIIQRAPGARGTRLHRKIGDDRTRVGVVGDLDAHPLGDVTLHRADRERHVGVDDLLRCQLGQVRALRAETVDEPGDVG